MPGLLLALHSTARLFAIVGGLLLVLLAASLATGSLSRELYRDRAREAVTSGVLAQKAFMPLGAGSEPYRYQYNDCLILTMLVLPPEAGLRGSVSPRAPRDYARSFTSGSVPRHWMCENLVRALRGPDIPADPYHRYIHGDWVLAGLLLAVMPFSTASLLLLSGVAALALGVLLAALTGLRRDRESAARSAAFAAMAGAFLLVSGVWHFGWSFSFAPSDMVLLGLLLFAYRHPFASLDAARLFQWMGLFGALTAAFEFLVGAAPTGVALILACIACQRGLARRGAASQALTAVGGFAAGFVLAFAGKLVLVGLLWGWPEVTAAGSQLTNKVAGTAPGIADKILAMGPFPRWLAEGRLGGMFFSGYKMAVYSGWMMFGSRTLGVLVAGACPALLVLSCAVVSVRSKSEDSRCRALLLMAAAAVLAVWYVLFVNHTIQHPNVMVRPLAWLTIFACGLGAWAAVERRRGVRA